MGNVLALGVSSGSSCLLHTQTSARAGAPANTQCPWSNSLEAHWCSVVSECRIRCNSVAILVLHHLLATGYPKATFGNLFFYTHRRNTRVVPWFGERLYLH